MISRTYLDAFRAHCRKVGRCFNESSVNFPGGYVDTPDMVVIPVTDSIDILSNRSGPEDFHVLLKSDMSVRFVEISGGNDSDSVIIPENISGDIPDFLIADFINAALELSADYREVTEYFHTPPVCICGNRLDGFSPVSPEITGRCPVCNRPVYVYSA